MLEVYTDPEPSGEHARYRNVRTLSGEDRLSTEAIGDLGARVVDVL